MKIASSIALALILLKPGATRDIHVKAAGQTVHIRAQMPRQYHGEPLRFDDGSGKNSCYDSSGELTVKCVDRFYGSVIGATFQFDSNGTMTDTITFLASHPNVSPLPPTTRTVQTVNKAAVVYRVFGYDESGITTENVVRFRKIQEPLWLEIREDVALDDRLIVSLYWRQTLNEIQLVRVEPH
jgi:hypothetical protein